MRRTPTIAVWGHYHGGNLGDEIVVATIVDAIRARLPGSRVVAISMAPADALARHGIPGYPINPGLPAVRSRSPTRARPVPRGRLGNVVRRVPGARRLRILANRLGSIGREVPFLVRSYRSLRSIDGVVVAGSGQLLDEWYGPWWHPYTTFRWAVLARLARVPMLYLSMGAGPIDHRLSAVFIRTALSSASYTSVRDGHSARVLESIGVGGHLTICPDMAYGLPAQLLPSVRVATTRADDRRVIGLNVMAHQDPRYWPRGDARRYDAYLRKMAVFARWLGDQGWTVRLFSSQTRSDDAVVADLLGLLADSGPVDPTRFIVESVEAIDELIGFLTQCDAVVAARYHSILLPLLLGVPVIGLAYNAKTSELLSDAGHPEACLDIDEFEPENLMEAFLGIATSDGREERTPQSLIWDHRASVVSQFDTVFRGGDVTPRQA